MISCMKLVFLSIILQQVHSISFGEEFYKIAIDLPNVNESYYSQLNKPIHLLRIPKASSSSLSTIARRLVGCEPPGPCCKWPGDPPGSCPSKRLFACQTEGRVIGCTHHYPNYDALLRKSTMSISIMREPKQRAVSAFFYPGIHHNNKCKSSIENCFREYSSSPKWKNIATKMITGAYAYGSELACEHERQCKNSLELAIRNLDYFAFMGVAEMWELSMLILHKKIPQLKPLLSDFLIFENSHSDSSLPVRSDAHRTNRDEPYQTFKQDAHIKYSELLSAQNGLDCILYQHVVQRLCNDVHKYQLWGNPLVRQYWAAKNVPSSTARNISMVSQYRC